MDMKYNFRSEKEPTDAQLEALMKEVIADVIKRREAADKAYWKLLEKEVKQVKKQTAFKKLLKSDKKMDEKPKLLIVAGPNGAGKTSVTGKILKHEWVEGCEYINPDNIAQDIFGDWNSREAVLKAAQYATKRREECLTNRENILFETVLSSPDKLDFIERAKNADYFIRLFFIGTNHPSINASRVAHRVLEGGHDVPISKIISRYYKSIANCIKAVNFVDRLYVYDNSIDNVFPQLLFRATNRQIENIYTENVNIWALTILSGLHK